MDYDYWIRIDRAGGCIQHVEEFLACSRLYAATKTLSCRTKIFDEIIRVCMKNAGFASLNYFLGLWHHLCHEDGSRFFGCFRDLPLFPQFMARLHHGWCNGLSPAATLGGMAKALKVRAKERFGPFVRLTHPVRRFLTAGSVRRLLASASGPKVVGYWGDNWMGATCKIRLQDSLVGERIHLTGSAPQDTELTVSCKGSTLGVFQLQANVLQNVTFDVTPDQGREVTLEFSKHIVDAAGRRVAFLLQGTNLFAEADLLA
jgi:hypothetical protein